MPPNIPFQAEPRVTLGSRTLRRLAPLLGGLTPVAMRLISSNVASYLDIGEPAVSEQRLPQVPPAEFRVLLALLDGTKHGHAIKLDIRERTGGRVDMGPGTLYGAIKRLVVRAWISEVDPPEADDDERRRYYTLTPAGRAAAQAEATRMAELLGIGRAKGLELAGGA